MSMRWNDIIRSRDGRWREGAWMVEADLTVSTVIPQEVEVEVWQKTWQRARAAGITVGRTPDGGDDGGGGLGGLPHGCLLLVSPWSPPINPQRSPDVPPIAHPDRCAPHRLSSCLSVPAADSPPRCPLSAPLQVWRRAPRGGDESGRITFLFGLWLGTSTDTTGGTASTRYLYMAL